MVLPYSTVHLYLPMMCHFLGDQHIITTTEADFLQAALTDLCTYLDLHLIQVDLWWEIVCSISTMLTFVCDSYLCPHIVLFVKIITSTSFVLSSTSTLWEVGACADWSSIYLFILFPSCYHRCSVWYATHNGSLWHGFAHGPWYHGRSFDNKLLPGGSAVFVSKLLCLAYF